MRDDVHFTPENMRLDFIPAGDERSPWVTVGEHRFQNTVFTVTVPDGFRSDLASVPAWLLWLFPPNGKHQRAALFHDAAYRLQYCDREVADAIFRAIMRRDRVTAWRRQAIYLAVRLFGGLAWERNATRVHKARVAMEGPAE